MSDRCRDASFVLTVAIDYRTVESLASRPPLVSVYGVALKRKLVDNNARFHEEACYSKSPEGRCSAPEIDSTIQYAYQYRLEASKAFLSTVFTSCLHESGGEHWVTAVGG